MRTALLGIAAAALIGTSAAVISGQHAPATHSAQHTSPPQAMLLHLCESAQGSSEDTARHVSMMAEKLDLTAEQRVTVVRVSTEACAAMARYHEQILAVLTPEQREKLKALHGHGEEGGMHAILKKLHGAR